MMELATSYVQGVSQSQTNTVQAYSDPTLPGINPTVGTRYATGAANYWPLWTDTSYFPTTTAYTPAGLNTAYQSLVTALIHMNVGLSDFANLNGAAVTDPAKIRQYLAQSYTTAFGKAPPTAPGSGPFPVAAATTPQDAVYEFFFNADLLRESIYPVLTGQGSSTNVGNLPSWVQQVINGISASSVPGNIAPTIASGQTQQVQNVTVNVTQPSQKESVGEILLGGLIWAAGSVIAAAVAVAAPETAVLLPLLAAGLSGGAASLGQSFLDNAYASGTQTVTLTVPVTAITNSELNYQTLNDMAGSIQAGSIQQWNNILQALTNAGFVQSVMSNFGLMKAFAPLRAPLSDPAMNPANAVTTAMTRNSWQEMIPATFTWTSVAPYAFPTGNGQTNDWTASGSTATAGESTFVGGITSADFNKDGKLDVATANNDTDDVSIMLAPEAAASKTVRRSAWTVPMERSGS